jgi:hypothetical protein
MIIEEHDWPVFQHLRRFVVALTLLALSSGNLGLAYAQSWGAEVRPKSSPTAPSPPSPQPQPVAPPPAAPPAAAARAPNTTVITKTPSVGMGAGQSAGPGQAEKGRGTQLTLQAMLVEGGARIEQGLIWRIYDAKQVEGKHRLITSLKDVAPSIRLAAGTYMINVAFGRANLTRMVTVKSGDPQAEAFVLNAGGLKVSALLANGEPAVERTAFFEIYSDERDQFGNRTKVLSGVRAGLIVRLNAGIYHIVSTYGDANATERSDVTVEAGKLTEATVRHSAARVTMKLVTQAGGEAQADTRWSVLGQDGQLVKESLGALPTHILQAGTYTAVARQGTASFSQPFTVAPGEVRQIEVVIK